MMSQYSCYLEIFIQYTFQQICTVAKFSWFQNVPLNLFLSPWGPMKFKAIINCCMFITLKLVNWSLCRSFVKNVVEAVFFLHFQLRHILELLNTYPYESILNFIILKARNMPTWVLTPSYIYHIYFLSNKAVSMQFVSPVKCPQQIRFTTQMVIPWNTNT